MPKRIANSLPLDPWSLKALKSSGFVGGLRVAGLQKACQQAGRAEFQIPRVPGVYLLVRHNREPVQFAIRSCGGKFKNRNPTLPITTLRRRWVSSAKVLYIGKAGSATTGATLHSRIRAYMRFGLGDPISHWGGRCIWQLTDARSLRVYWKTTPGRSARALEKRLLVNFRRRYGRLPFANLIG